MFKATFKSEGIDTTETFDSIGRAIQWVRSWAWNGFIGEWVVYNADGSVYCTY